MKHQGGNQIVRAGGNKCGTLRSEKQQILLYIFLFRNKK